MLNPKAISVKPLDNYLLELVFDSGEKKVFDVKPYLSGSWFSKLKDIKQFNTVHIAGLSIEWAGGQDISPHELYDDSVPL